jgi:phosphoglycolate phosphatase
MAKTILFDLDGTITDSGEGIINCAELALRHFGLPVPDRAAMRVFVGPPLDETFMKFGVHPDQTDEAIRVYRSRYIPIGKFENSPYPGVEDLLARLKARGHKLYIATSKPEQMSVDILEHFGLAKYFDRICGATMDGSRSKKADIITYLLQSTGAAADAIMVGDTAYDVIGAAEHQIPCIGVSWGYGLIEDMEKAGAVGIAHSPEALMQMIL